MTEDLTPDPDAMLRMAEMDQAAAGLRSIADAIVTMRRTLVEGGINDQVADQMIMRTWMQFFPGPMGGPLGFLFGGAPPQ